MHLSLIALNVAVLCGLTLAGPLGVKDKIEIGCTLGRCHMDDRYDADLNAVLSRVETEEHDLGPLGFPETQQSFQTPTSGLHSKPDILVRVSESSPSHSRLLPTYEPSRQDLPPPLNSTEVTILYDKKLGEGKHGVVYECTYQTDTRCAIKKLNRDEETDRVIINEIMILHKVEKHRYITDFIGWYETRQHFYLVLEFAQNGDLEHLLARKHILRDGTIRRFAIEIATALQFVHDKHMIFRDLKLDNVLLANNGDIRLNDFGIAVKTISGVAHHAEVNFPHARAPELVLGLQYTKAIDWWALGVLLYELVTQKKPFGDTQSLDLESRIVHSEVTFPSSVPDLCRDLIGWLLRKKPEDRPQSAPEFMDHDFFHKQGSCFQYVL